MYRYFSCIFNSKEDEIDKVDKAEQARVLGKKVSGASIRCGASLVFASIGAGIGATLIRPSLGQWIGKQPTPTLLYQFIHASLWMTL